MLLKENEDIELDFFSNNESIKWINLVYFISKCRKTIIKQVCKRVVCNSIVIPKYPKFSIKSMVCSGRSLQCALMIHVLHDPAGRDVFLRFLANYVFSLTRLDTSKRVSALLLALEKLRCALI